MKRIRQHRLRKGPAGRVRVVELDLLEVDASGVSLDGRGYLVNYRVGRQGQPLQEGTRTPLPVDRARAERILERELGRRRSDGYVEAGEPAGAAASGGGGLEAAPAREPAAMESGASGAPPSFGDSAEDGRKQTILGHLKRPGFAPPGRTRTRLIQRAGDLRLAAATPSLVAELSVAHGIHRIVLAWALARVASPGCAGALHTLAKDPSEPVRRFALAGLLSIPSEAPAVRSALIDELPSGIARTLSDPTALGEALDAWLAGDGADRPLVLVSVALLHTPATQAALHACLQRLRLAPPTWRALRRIYKLAELRDDGVLLGVLARRIETTRAQPGTGWKYTWTRETGRVAIVDAIKAGSDRFGYTIPTRAWFRRRITRTLKRRGLDGSPAYVPLALGVLAAFDGVRGAGPPRPVGHILLAHSQIWYPSPRLGPWERTGMDEPRGVRSEAFPELWDARPDALVKLALGGYTTDGISVGCRALADRSDLRRVLTVEQVVRLISSGTDEQRELGLRGARAHWDPAHPSLPLLAAMAHSPDFTARALAHGWIHAAGRVVLSAPAFLADLLASPQPETRALAQSLVGAARTVPGVEAALVTELLTTLTALPAATEPEDPTAEVVAHLGSVFAAELADLLRIWPFDALVPLLDAARADVRLLAARLLAGLELPVESLPEAVLAHWTTHPDAAVRAVGVEVFGRLPDGHLKAHLSVLMAMVSAPVPPVRRAITPVVARLCTDAAFAEQVWTWLGGLLRHSEVDPTIQAELAAFAQDHLGAVLAGLEPTAVWALLDAPGGAAQAVGASLLHRLRPSALYVREVVRLADHDMQQVRAAAQAWIAQEPERYCAEDAHLLRLIDAAWPDTRALGAALLRAHRPPDRLDPALLVAICDSPRREVQHLGRQLIPELFQRAHGPVLLARLAEHPSPEMQRFVSGLVPGHAAGHPDRIRALMPYFLAVLSGVSRGGVAKARAFDFFGTHVVGDPELARWALPLLERVSGSISVQDRARAIALLARIRREHGVAGSVLTVVAAPVRGEDARGA